MTWEEMKDTRSQALADYDQASFEFDRNYGKQLPLEEVILTERFHANYAGEPRALTFYYFVTYGDTLHTAKRLFSSLKFLEYLLLEVKKLSQHRCAILICGQQDILNRLGRLLPWEELKLCATAVVRPDIYQRLSFSIKYPAFIVTDRKNKVVWCTLRRPSDVMLSELIEKLTTARPGQD